MVPFLTNSTIEFYYAGIQGLVFLCKVYVMHTCKLPIQHIFNYLIGLDALTSLFALTPLELSEYRVGEQYDKSKKHQKFQK